MRSRVFRLIELIMYGGLWHGDDLDIHRKIRKKVKMSAQFTGEKFICIHGHHFTAVDTILTLGACLQTLPGHSMKRKEGEGIEENIIIVCEEFLADMIDGNASRGRKGIQLWVVDRQTVRWKPHW
ncbi:hypothetical protein TNIN_117931 [Trichonephila inaurata madagascariensis]|uniref:Uncharacterized protein n=1 Tax=Trichonephila inaurata madagascariensis TaxID=2747483 RepID=A0A8X6YLE7_9ARAC|nr:hypothetical protein TNIN_117931 [Trichonephila inaurata madagascariensis]